VAVAIPILMVASAAVAAYGAIQQGKAAKAAASFNEAIGRQNADISRENARVQAAQVDRENFLRLGAIRAAQGASGGTPEGSVLDVLADTARQGEMERQYELYKGEAAARGYTNTASLDALQGREASRASYLRAGTELLSGASGAGRAYTGLNRV
jgi:hypothetical protein